MMSPLKQLLIFSTLSWFSKELFAWKLLFVFWAHRMWGSNFCEQLILIHSASAKFESRRSVHVSIWTYLGRMLPPTDKATGQRSGNAYGCSHTLPSFIFIGLFPHRDCAFALCDQKVVLLLQVVALFWNWWLLKAWKLTGIDLCHFIMPWKHKYVLHNVRLLGDSQSMSLFTAFQIISGTFVIKMSK